MRPAPVNSFDQPTRANPNISQNYLTNLVHDRIQALQDITIRAQSTPGNFDPSTLPATHPIFQFPWWRRLIDWMTITPGLR
jgi:hypothetical protein